MTISVDFVATLTRSAAKLLTLQTLFGVAVTKPIGQAFVELTAIRPKIGPWAGIFAEFANATVVFAIAA